jgi:hypothetical protein
VSCSCEHVDQRRARHAAQDVVIGGAGDETPVSGDDPGVGGRAFGDEALGVDQPRLEAALLAGVLFGEHIGQQAGRLDVAPRPALVGPGDDRDALGRPRVGFGAGARPRGDDQRRPHVVRERKIARRGAARHLQIDRTFGDAVAPRHLAQHDEQRRPSHRRRHAQFGERTVEPVEMAGGVDQRPVADFADLVDRVGELEAAILDVHRALAMGNVTAVDIGDAAHAEGPFTG